MGDVDQLSLSQFKKWSRQIKFIDFINVPIFPSPFFIMQVIGPGVKEIHIHVLGEWRVIYVAKLRDAVYVLHAFQKKTLKTSRHDIDLARQRYRQIGGNL